MIMKKIVYLILVILLIVGCNNKVEENDLKSNQKENIINEEPKEKILEYVDTKIIECNLNATNDDLFYYCRSYIIDKYDTFCLYKFVPPFDNVHFNQICYECDSVRKSKYSPNDTFVTLFRICYEHRNKLMNEKYL